MRLPWDVKTRYLYRMGSRLVKVRLDEERVRKAQTLREHGVPLSLPGYLGGIPILPA
jgi:hypothetical protein